MSIDGDASHLLIQRNLRRAEALAGNAALKSGEMSAFDRSILQQRLNQHRVIVYDMICYARSSS